MTRSAGFYFSAGGFPLPNTDSPMGQSLDRFKSGLRSIFPDLSGTVRGNPRCQSAITRQEHVIGASRERHAEGQGFGQLPIVVREACKNGTRALFFKRREHCIIILPPAIDDHLNSPTVDANGGRSRYMTPDHPERKNTRLSDKQ